MRWDGNYASNHSLTIGREEEYSHILRHSVLFQTLLRKVSVRV